MDFKKDLDEYNEKVTYYFKTPDNKPYAGNTNIKFVGKNNKVYYTGKTYTRYSQVLEHIPKGFSVNENHYSTAFTFWGKQKEETDYTLDPIFGPGQSQDDNFKRNILGYQLVARDNMGKKDVLFSSSDEAKVKDLFENIKRFPTQTTSSSSAGTTQQVSSSSAGSTLQSPINTGISSLTSPQSTPSPPQNLISLFDEEGETSPIGAPTPLTPAPYVPFLNAITQAPIDVHPNRLLSLEEFRQRIDDNFEAQNAANEAAWQRRVNEDLAAPAANIRPVTPEPSGGSSSKSVMSGETAKSFIQTNIVLFRRRIADLSPSVKSSRTKIASALSGVFGVSENSIKDVLKNDETLYKNDKN